MNESDKTSRLPDLNSDKNDLIGKIYDSATNPGEWFDLIEAIAEYTQPIVNENSVEVYKSPEVLENLIFHLERAARNSEYIYLLEDQKQTLNIIYNNMPWPLLMLDSQMRLIDANQAARQFLNNSSPISIGEDNLLKFQDKNLKKNLKSFFKFGNGTRSKNITL